jgi:predicted signal transduction protein with EAL and GGDEF domain
MVTVDASLGLAVFPDDAEDEESLCIKADLRMYEFKRTAGAGLSFTPQQEALASDPVRLDNETAVF